MKVLPGALIASVILLNGCASSGQNVSSSESTVRWWNPLTYSWSSALPWNWFGSSLQVSEQGVGKVTSSTAFSTTAIGSAIGSDYRLRQGMGTHNGQIENYIQAMKGQQLAMTFYGDSTVKKVNILDPQVTTDQGIKLGSSFSELYHKAFGHCQPGQDSQHVQCKAPNSQHIDYIYHGDFSGPAGIMPADETLKQWKLAEIVWHA